MIGIIAFLISYVPGPIDPQNPPKSNDEDTPDITDAPDRTSATGSVVGALLKRVGKMR